MEPHLCRTCQRLARDACARCSGWCCEKPNDDGRIALTERDKERFGFRRDYMKADPCRYRDPETGICVWLVRDMPVACKEYVCEDMVKLARRRLKQRASS